MSDPIPPMASAERILSACSALRVAAGIDLGKSFARAAVLAKGDDGRLEVVSTLYEDHGGDPIGWFAEWYRQRRPGGLTTLAVTGLHADRLVATVPRFPEDLCQQAALDYFHPEPVTVNLVRVGARGYGALTRLASSGQPGGGTIHDYYENDKCSSGSGENMARIAGRFGLSISEADDLAWGASDPMPIAARCSVFAKSELTHYANQGFPRDRLLAGHFRSVARNASALALRNRVEGPVLLIGGGSRIRSLKRELEQFFGGPIAIPEHALVFEALGAALLALERADMVLPAEPESLLRPATRRFTVLPAAADSREQVTRLPQPNVPERGPVVLGIDIGSTGSKAVLCDLATGEMVADAYDRTRGDPVSAALGLIAGLLRDFAPDIRAFSLTGSGREAAALVFEAGCSQETGRLIVRNEIVAHATAACHCDPRGGEDLSIVEIGGQDAKYIRLQGGRIVESDLNHACSAGTGSFLEEQAGLHGVADIAEMTRLATAAVRAPDLGQMCTVYVADAAAEALREGFTVGELFAGFQYSVIHNYINRVMGQRQFGETVFFQGKPASNPSLAWTLAAVAGRPVTVPCNPGAMGAWGIALLTRRLLGADSLSHATTLDLRSLLDARIGARSEFVCADPGCDHHCRIARVSVQCGGDSRTVVSGGACPKYERTAPALPKLPREAPDPFRQRQAELDRLLELTPDPADGPLVGVPLALSSALVAPWLVTFLRALGARVNVLRPATDALAIVETLCYSFDACCSIKITHHVCLSADTPWLLLPKVIQVRDEDNGEDARTCPLEQAIPEMLEPALAKTAFKPLLLRPQLWFPPSWKGPRLIAALRAVAERRGLDPARVSSAVGAAARAQREFELACHSIGERALEYGRSRKTPMVLVCGPQHVIHEPLINSGIPNLFRENGVLALPMDCLPIGDGVPRMGRIYWNYANRTLRTAARARLDGDIFPVMISSFGCGPGSFTEPVFTAMLQGYPHTVLESDGHGGTAGFRTRIQAFIHTINEFRQRQKAPAPLPAAVDWFQGKVKQRTRKMDRDTRYVMFAFTDRMTRFAAASFRSFGLDVHTSRSTSDALAVGKRDCSGKECLPYQIFWGAFRHFLETNPSDKPTVLLQITGGVTCRDGMFSIKDKLSASRLCHLGQLDIDLFKPFKSPVVALKIWAGIVAWDLARTLSVYHHAFAPGTGEARRLYERYCDRIEALMEEPPDLLPPWGLKNGLRKLSALIAEMSRDYRSLALQAGDGNDAPLVLMSGDALCRHDDLVVQETIDTLSANGVRVLAEPVSLLLEYQACIKSTDLHGNSAKPILNWLTRETMARLRRPPSSLVRPDHPWLPMPDPPAVLATSRRFLDNEPRGEGPLTIGSIVHHCEKGDCAGAVVVSPWGCAPALIAESVLRHRRDIPVLFLYADGMPVDQNKAVSFALRLRRRGSVVAGE